MNDRAASDGREGAGDSLVVVWVWGKRWYPGVRAQLVEKRKVCIEAERENELGLGHEKGSGLGDHRQEQRGSPRWQVQAGLGVEGPFSPEVAVPRMVPLMAAASF